jgi:hypothetical protein
VQFTQIGILLKILSSETRDYTNSFFRKEKGNRIIDLKIFASNYRSDNRSLYNRSVCANTEKIAVV